MRAVRVGMAGALVAAVIVPAAACGGSGGSGGDAAERQPATTATSVAAPATTTTAGGQADAPLEVTGQGFALVRSDAGDGLYVGALVANPSSLVVADQEVAFDLLDASGGVIGAAEAVDVNIEPGGVGAAGTTANPGDCGCDLTKVARVRALVEDAGGRIDPESAAIPLFTDAEIGGGGGTLTISGTLVNATGSDLEPLDTATFVVSDAAGTVLGGGYTSIGVDVAAGESAAVTLTPPASFGESLARPPATVAVSVD